MSPAGRPEIGQPINVRLGVGLLALVDDYAKTQDISRAEAVRRLVQTGIGATPKSELIGPSERQKIPAVSEPTAGFDKTAGTARGGKMLVRSTRKAGNPGSNPGGSLRGASC